jgi:hypothetical protein
MEQKADVFKHLDLGMVAHERNEVPVFFIGADASADYPDPVRSQAQHPFQPFPLAFS